MQQKQIIKFRNLLENLPKIKFQNNELNWNSSKTEEQFKERIRNRTNLSVEQFVQTIQKGIDKTNIPIDTSICLYFIVSKFVLILNTKDLFIVTVRDGRWDKPSNTCNKIIMVNEDVQKLEQYEIDYLNEGKYFKMDFDNDFNMILESKCNYCFSINL